MTPRASAAAAALVCVGLAGCGGSSSPLPDNWQRGMNLPGYQPDAFSTPAAQHALQDLKRIGTDHVALVTTWYMPNKNATQIAPDPAKTPTDASVLAGAARARKLGMTVVINPHVDVADGTFRGEIAPSNSQQWFTSYRAMTNHYAELAQQAQAEIFVVGDELTTMSQQTAEFERVIKEARSRFHGEMTYGANWTQGAEQAKFWRSLDYIGIDAYMPLLDGANPPVDAIEQAWQKQRPAIDKLHEQYDKPVLFVELGYPSREGTASKPSEEGSGAPNPLPQARAYEAAYRFWRTVPYFRGIYWWEWPVEGRGMADDGSYSPEQKLAEQTIGSFERR